MRVVVRRCGRGRVWPLDIEITAEPANEIGTLKVAKNRKTRIARLLVELFHDRCGTPGENEHALSEIVLVPVGLENAILHGS